MAGGIFITGATGFVGTEVLTHLVRSYPSRHIWLLVRNGPRCDTLLRSLSVSPEFQQRFSIVRGDLSVPDLGLSERYSPLASSTDIILHFAADTSLEGSPLGGTNINLIGTRHVIRFGRKASLLGGLSRFIHISTAFVSGLRGGVIRESDLSGNYGFANVYERTKYEAELEVHRASDILWTIVRPSIIAGDSATGWTDQYNGFYRIMKGVCNGTLKWLPGKPETRIDVVPIDYVCKSISALIQITDATMQTLHLVGGKDWTLSLIDWMRIIAEHENRRHSKSGEIRRVFVPEFFNPIHHNRKRKDGRRTIAQITIRIMRRYLPYTKIQRVYDNSAAHCILQHTNIKKPDLRRWANQVVDFAVRSGFVSRKYRDSPTPY